MAQDYSNLEILVIDGRSTDRTVEIIRTLQQQDARICLLDNPGEWQSRGLNIGLKHARGDIIARVDGHTIIAPDYIRQCVYLFETHPEVESVGGILRAVGKTPIAQAVALSYRSRFAVPSIVRHAAEDTYAFGAYMGIWRRNSLDKIDGWREDYRVQEDYEYYYRFGQAGGRTLISMRIKSDYYCRDTWSALWIQYFRYGRGKVKMLRDHPESLEWRHIVPPLFILMIVLGVLLPVSYIWLILYGGINFFVSLYHTRGNLKMLWRLMLVFVIVHAAWGIGFWAEVFSLFVGRLVKKG